MAVSQITTVLSPATCERHAHPYDLTDLATVKDELSLTDTSQDMKLCRYIRQASRAISNYCNRVFHLEALQDVFYIEQDPYPYQVPGGVYPLQMARWPLHRTESASFTGNTHSSLLIDGISSTTGLKAGTLIFGAGLALGTRIARVTGTSSVTLDTAATATASGVSFTTGVQVTQLLAVGVTNVLVAGTDFTANNRPGSLIRLNSWTGISQKWEAWPTTVQYQAGFERIPDDLSDACLRLVTQFYTNKGRNPMLFERVQPNLGSERWWVNTNTGQSGALPPEIASLVDHYRVPVIA